MGYHRDPKNRDYWCYDGLRIQADVHTHRLVVETARSMLATSATVLDVAAGEGALAKQLLDSGFNVACTSWDDKNCLAVPMYRLNLDHAFNHEQVGDRFYDFVCAIEVIEHLENPACFLRSCTSILAPGGHLMLSTPNVESAEARLQWLIHGHPRIFSGFEVQHNRHISMQWRQGLEYLVGQAGLRIVHKWLVGRYRARRSPMHWPKLAAYWLMERTLPGDTTGTSRVYLLTPTVADRQTNSGSDYAHDRCRAG